MQAPCNTPIADALEAMEPQQRLAYLVDMIDKTAAMVRLAGETARAVEAMAGRHGSALGLVTPAAIGKRLATLEGVRRVILADAFAPLAAPQRRELVEALFAMSIAVAREQVEYLDLLHTAQAPATAPAANVIRFRPRQ